MEIDLRGPDRRVDDTMYPVLVDYRNLTINGKKLFGEQRELWYNKRYIHKIKANDNDSIHVAFEARKHHFTISDITRYYQKHLWVLFAIPVFSFILAYWMVQHITRKTKPLHSPTNSKAKIKSIELLRFLLAWVIVFAHFYHFPHWFGWAPEYRYFTRGSIAVECFFIMTFFFLVLQTNKEKSWIDFCASRWVRLSPLIAVVTLMGYIYGMDPRWHLLDNLLNIFCVQTWLQFPPKNTVPQAWYCSTLFGISLIYLLLVKSFSKQKLTFLISLLSFIGLYGMLRPKEVGLISIYNGNGVCRAFLCLGIGYLLASAYKNRKESNPPCAWSYTIAEALILAFLAYAFALCSSSHSIFGDRYVIVTAFASIFWLFLNKRGYISRLLEQDWCVILGRYSYSIFIVHLFVRTVAAAAAKNDTILDFSKSHPCLFIFIMCVITMALAASAYHLVEEPLIRWYKNRKVNNFRKMDTIEATLPHAS